MVGVVRNVGSVSVVLVDESRWGCEKQKHEIFLCFYLIA